MATLPRTGGLELGDQLAETCCKDPEYLWNKKAAHELHTVYYFPLLIVRSQLVKHLRWTMSSYLVDCFGAPRIQGWSVSRNTCPILFPSSKLGCVYIQTKTFFFYLIFLLWPETFSAFLSTVRRLCILWGTNIYLWYNIYIWVSLMFVYSKVGGKFVQTMFY